MAPKSSARQDGGTKVQDKNVKNPPTQQPKAKEQTGSDGRPNAHVVLNGATTAVDMERADIHISQLQESVGEHVADYYCNDTLKWGAKHGKMVSHDQGQRGAMLSDGGKLSPLRSRPNKARGGGIDAIWLGGTAPYAVTGYKARQVFMSAQQMSELLKEESVQDMNDKPAHRQNQKAWRQQKKVAQKHNQLFNDPKPDLAKDVPKMTHKWIRQRFGKVAGLSATQIEDLEDPKSYTRHVIHVVTGRGDGRIHRAELEAARSEKREVDVVKHLIHEEGVFNYTNVFTDPLPAKNKTAPGPVQGRNKRG